MPTHLAPASIPVLADVDLLVLGADVISVAAAVAARRRGLTVYLAEQGLSVGTDLTRSLRLWVDPEDLASPLSEPDQTIKRTIVGARSGCHALALWPDQLKLDLEQLILTTGISLGYNLTPLVVEGATEGYACLFAAKGGRWAIRARTVMASPDHHHVLGAQPQPRRAIASYCFELTGVSGAPPSSPLTVDLEEGTTWAVHPGWQGPGHQILEVITEVDLGRNGQPSSAALSRLYRLVLGEFERRTGTDPAYARVQLAGLARAPSVGGERAPVQTAPGLVALPRLLLLGPGAPSTSCVSEAIRQGSRIGTDVVTLGPGLPSMQPAGTARDLLELDEGPKRRPGRPRQTMLSPAVPIDERRTTDVLVVGAGSSGLSAAVYAAMGGAEVICAWNDLLPGGTGTAGGVANYWFGRRVGASRRVHAAVKTLHAAMNQVGGGNGWNIAVKSLALAQLLDESHVVPLPQAVLLGVIRDGRRVTGAVFGTPEGSVLVEAGVTIDATGDGDVAHAAGAATRYGAVRTYDTMWCSLAQFPEPGQTKNNFGGVVDVGDPDDYTRAVIAGRRRGGTLHDHGEYLAPRESRSIVGEVTINLLDVLQRTRWPDTVNIHYANYDVKGKSSSVWTLGGLIPPHTAVEVPLRALLPRGVEGLLVTGRALSATHDALPGIRMQSDMENLGAASGVIAAVAMATGGRLDQLDIEDVRARLQSHGILPSAPTSTPQVGTRSGEAIVADLAGGQPPWAWADKVSRNPAAPVRLPIVEAVLSTDERMDELLVGALGGADLVARATLAQALVLRGRPEGASTLLSILRKGFSGKQLPVRASAIRHTQLPPDQGAAPKEAYWLYTLGLARVPEAVEIWQLVADRLGASRAALRDLTTGHFAYIDAVCSGAERLASPAAIGLLQQLRSDPSLRAQVRTGPTDEEEFQERQAMLELALARALARCGAAAGHRLLVDYLLDSRSLFARSAHEELVALHGVDLGDDPGPWIRTVEDPSFHPAPAPLGREFDVAAADGLGVPPPVHDRPHPVSEAEPPRDPNPAGTSCATIRP